MSSVSKIQKLLQQAVAHHQAGRLSAAESLYAKVIKAEPRNADALHLMGVIAHSRNESVKAKTFFDRAIKCAPNIPDIHLNFANFLAATDDLQGALAAYARAIALKPALFAAHLGLGGVLYRLGRFDEAAGCFRNAVAIAPQDPRGHFNLGQCLLRLSLRDDAEASLRRAVELEPTYVEAHVALANLYTDAARTKEAIYHTQRMVQLKPTAEYYSSLGEFLRLSGDVEAALAAHRVAEKAKPDDPTILHNFGAALHAAERYGEAEKVFRRAIEQDPNFISGYVGLAKVFEFQDRPGEVIAILKEALARDPGALGVLFKLSLRHLKAGDFAEGWKEYESRFSTPDQKQSRRPSPPAYWGGEDLTEKTILVWTEQGPGDEILYGTMIPDVVARAKRCIVECSPRMAPIFARSFPQATVRAHQSQSAAGPSQTEIDFQAPVASLGQFLRRDFESFPNRQGYLHADATRAAALRARYRAITPGNLVVGISWRSRNEEIAMIKSTHLSAWAEILRVPGVTFINLQYGDCADEVAAVKRDLGVEVFEDREINALESLDDFFAQVAAMDIVISTSNTTIHVAGSLNVPTWLLLSGRPGALWYWFQDRPDSPWYSSLKVLRGASQGVVPTSESPWAEVMATAARDLGICRLNPPK